MIHYPKSSKYIVSRLPIRLLVTIPLDVNMGYTTLIRVAVEDYFDGKFPRLRTKIRAFSSGSTLYTRVHLLGSSYSAWVDKPMHKDRLYRYHIISSRSNLVTPLRLVVKFCNMSFSDIDIDKVTRSQRLIGFAYRTVKITFLTLLWQSPSGACPSYGIIQFTEELLLRKACW